MSICATTAVCLGHHICVKIASNTCGVNYYDLDRLPDVDIKNMAKMTTRANVAKTTHKMPVLVTCYRCKKSVDEKKTALCSICKNRMEPDCNGYPLQTYRLKSQESKTKWRCSKCTKKTVPKNVPSPDDNISNNVTVRKKPAYSINHLHTDIYKNKRKLLSPNQDSHILSDYDTSCETDTTTPKRLLTDSLDGSSTIKSPILYYEMQDTIAQLTTKLECAENALECKTLQNNELNKQVEELTKEIKLLKSICNSSTIIESSPIVNNKNNRQSFTSQDIFSTPTSGRLPLDVEDPTETTYRHLHKTIATLQKELTCAEQEIKTLNAQIQGLWRTTMRRSSSSSYSFQGDHECKQSEIKKRRARRQRRWWMKKIHHNRTRQFIEEKFNELLYEPSGEFDNFCRMSYSDFEFLLQKISPMISKHDTDFREAIPAKFRLAITLRFLASGDSYKSLHYLFKVSVPMISIIIREVCRALNEILKDLVKSSFDVYDSSGNMVTPGSWRRDNDEYNALQNLPQIPRRSPVNAREVREEFTSYFNRIG
ncbi:hypothetical protein HW555_003865 [Spodoptera exigua]|uniref:Transposase Helix-turn-helix domain-containing protein n=1 Tax=Spodoptera exigua TaxID=7107 RepID=A0A835L803_SPOEX|nr:hypothetical protein HW555_003865 [Spodoptera exigua]